MSVQLDFVTDASSKKKTPNTKLIAEQQRMMRQGCKWIDEDT
jgi:hypothetical protein